jgi:hypothetical protein
LLGLERGPVLAARCGQQEIGRMETGTLTNRLQQIQGELEVRAHLAALDARTAWDGLHLERIRDELVTVRDEARVQAHLGAMDAKDVWARLDSELRAVAGKTGAAADDAMKAITHAVGQLVPPPKTVKKAGVL